MTKTLNLILAGITTGALLLAGCEKGSKEVNPGLDSFDASIPSVHKEMYSGESSEVIADLRTNYVYEIYIEGSNDGPSDRISIHADDEKIGSYTTQAISMGGKGWYHSQFSPTFRFVPKRDLTTFRIHIDSADKYGTSPNWIYANRVVE